MHAEREKKNKKSSAQWNKNGPELEASPIGEFEISIPGLYYSDYYHWVHWGNWEIDRKRKVKMNVSFEGPWNRKINLCPVEILTPPPLFLFPLWRDARLKWATTAPAFSPLDWTWKRFCVCVSVIVLCDVLCIPLAPRNYFRTAPRVFIGRKAR